MASAWQLFYGRDEIARISTPEELREALIRARDRIEGGNPVLALAHPDGRLMWVGLSSELGFLDYEEAPGKTPHRVSVAEPDMAPEDALLVFDCAGQESEVPLRYCVPFEVLLRVLEEYVATGKLSASIAWE